jgi:hypothetical protein
MNRKKRTDGEKHLLRFSGCIFTVYVVTLPVTFGSNLLALPSLSDAVPMQATLFFPNPSLRHGMDSGGKKRRCQKDQCAYNSLFPIPVVYILTVPLITEKNRRSNNLFGDVHPSPLVRRRALWHPTRLFFLFHPSLLTGKLNLGFLQ